MSGGYKCVYWAIEGFETVKPIPFKQQNIVFAENQPEYMPLPALKSGANGEVITCWGLTWRERLRLLFTGKLWLRVLTFDRPLQPLLPEVESPFER